MRAAVLRTIAPAHAALSDAQQELHEGAVADSPGLARDQEVADNALSESGRSRCLARPAAD